MFTSEHYFIPEALNFTMPAVNQTIGELGTQALNTTRKVLTEADQLYIRGQVS
jgi:hypothetical protein